MPDDAHQTATPGSETWTTRLLLQWMSRYFAEREIEAPRLTGEHLLAHVIGCERLRLYMEADRPASSGELAALRRLVRRVAAHEPVQFILGEWDFYGRPFEVAPCTQIPQPATETLVERVVHEMRKRDSSWGERVSRPRGLDARSPRISDIGTGTGCIAVTLALELPSSKIVATDITDDVLELARRNAARHGVSDRIEFRLGSLFEPLEGEQFDAICSNPPYIPDTEWREQVAHGDSTGRVDRSVRDYVHERALRAGPDGLRYIRPIIEFAPRHLAKDGILAIEIADSHSDQVRRLIGEKSEYAESEILKDTDGLNRVAIAVRR